MKKFTWAVITGIVLAGSLAAGPVYQINFAGTITTGQASDFNPATNTMEHFADLTGMQVSGWLRFDLGLAPAPVVTDSGGSVQTSINGDGGPIFISEHFVIGGGLTVPGNLFPMPTSTFDLAPIPTLPAGSTVNQNADNQSLVFSTVTGGTAEAVLPGMQYAYSWTGPQLQGSDLIAVFLLASSLHRFFPILPNGGIPPTFGPENDGVNGVFMFFELAQDLTNPPTAANHFGITTEYQVNGNFRLDSASGFQAPEPGTLVLSASVLALALLCKSRQLAGVTT